MIYGIGVDMEEVAAVPRSVFTTRERGEAYSLDTLAGKFAAKEALYKALGGQPLFADLLTKVEVLNDARGKPYFEISHRGLNNILRLTNIQLSISHSSGYAIAMVIIDGQDPNGVFESQLQYILEEETKDGKRRQGDDESTAGQESAAVERKDEAGGGEEARYKATDIYPSGSTEHYYPTTPNNFGRSAIIKGDFSRIEIKRT